MSRTFKADVIVPVYPDAATILRVIESALEHSGPELGRLIVIDDRAMQPGPVEDLDRVADLDARVHIIRHSTRLGHIGLYNRGLAERAGDAVLLSGDCIALGDWLSELAAVVYSDERTACASPLTNGDGTGPAFDLIGDMTPRAMIGSSLRTACAGLPRWTVAPKLTAACIYLRGSVLDAVGLLDHRLESASAAIDHWLSRCQSLGFMAKRANRAFVQIARPRTTGTEAPMPDGDRPQLGWTDALHDKRFRVFCKSLDGRLPSHAATAQLTGKIRVALDIRHLSKEQVGTRTLAVCLANALAEHSEVDLTLLVRDRAQARGLNGRVVTQEKWADDVAVIHRPAQVLKSDELAILFRSSAHVIISYLDLIGYRIPSSFPSELEFDMYRATSGMSLQAVQRIIAISENARDEIATEFGIPVEEISVVPLGVDAGWFAQRDPRDHATLRGLRIPARYFFSLATDFPHKNLPNLLEAYSLFRSRWRGSEPPGLVLAGHASTARTDCYRTLELNPREMGLTFLGPVTRDQLRVLYQNAAALVFPSLYEGFGLPPLEAMAAGTPVIAMPISAIPEVGGDCVLYPDGLSVADLASAMERIIVDEALREDLQARGLGRVEQFGWARTARQTVEVYRSTVFRPSERSLLMRRLLVDSIIHWSGDQERVDMLASYERMIAGVLPSIGIRNACKSLQAAVRTRLRRELRRFPPIIARKSG
jgi:glycosyltransferase involved in cell wall biosynthesis